MLRPTFRLIIRNKGSDIAAGTGHAADKGTDEGGTQKRAEHPLDIVSVGDIVDVRVIDVDTNKGRISLSMILDEKEAANRSYKNNSDKNGDKKNNKNNGSRNNKNNAGRKSSKQQGLNLRGLEKFMH